MVDLGEDDRGFCPRAFQCSSLDRFPHTAARCGHLHCDRWDSSCDSRVTDPIDVPTRSKLLSADTLYCKVTLDVSEHGVRIAGEASSDHWARCDLRAAGGGVRPAGVGGAARLER